MSTIKANTLLHSDGSTTTQPSIPALDQRMAKAWVNFNGTGTVAIRDSYNVSSITDNGTGDYSVTFTNAMSNSNYSVSGTAHRSGGDNNAGMCIHGGSDPTTTVLRIAGRYPSTANAKDYSGIHIQVLGS